MADPEPTTAVLGRAMEGSAGALEALYARCAPRLLALIRLRMGRSLRARLESRDILHATLLKSFQELRHLRGAQGASLMAWLAKIAENEIRDRADYHGRKRRSIERETPLDNAGVQMAAEITSALSRVIFSEQAERLERAIEALSPDHREIILLRKFEERSFADIARRLGRSEDACRMLLARAMAALTLKFKETET